MAKEVKTEVPTVERPAAIEDLSKMIEQSLAWLRATLKELGIKETH